MSASHPGIYEEQKKLVLARFKTLNSESKLLLGGNGEYSVRELIEHVEDGDEFGKQIVRVQINLLKSLAASGK